MPKLILIRKSLLSGQIMEKGGPKFAPPKMPKNSIHTWVPHMFTFKWAHCHHTLNWWQLALFHLLSTNTNGFLTKMRSTSSPPMTPAPHYLLGTNTTIILYSFYSMAKPHAVVELFCSHGKKFAATSKISFPFNSSATTSCNITIHYLRHTLYVPNSLNSPKNPISLTLFLPHVSCVYISPQHYTFQDTIITPIIITL